MSKSSLFKKVCRQICLAQLASDEAKGNHYGGLDYRNNALKSYFIPLNRNECYDEKDKHILNAITIIDNNSPFGINYYLIHDKDQHGYPCYIIYFELKIKGWKLQISFHSFSKNLGKRLNNKKTLQKGRKTKWNKEIGGSRENCQMIINHFGF